MYAKLCVQSLDENGKNVVKKFLAFRTVDHPLLTLTSSFYVLIFIDELNVEIASKIFGFGFLFQALMDYGNPLTTNYLLIVD